MLPEKVFLVFGALSVNGFLTPIVMGFESVTTFPLARVVALRRYRDALRVQVSLSRHDVFKTPRIGSHGFRNQTLHSE